MNSKLTEITGNLLPKQKFNSIAYGCTSGTIASGNKVVKKKILKAKPGAKVSDPISAAINAFKKLKIKKLTILTPYAQSINKTVVDYLNKHNFKILSFHYLNLSSDVDIGQVDTNFLYKYLSKIKLNDSDGLFISCTALPVLDILDKLEKKLKKPVLSSNQVLIWESLRNTGYKVFPINPHTDNKIINGEKVYNNLEEIDDHVGIVNVFRPSEETIEIAKQSIKIGSNVFWCQLGIHNESAAKLISENKIYYISNKCIKVEYERLFRKI